MAEDREQEDPTISPLFNKMDALLARHRGARPEPDIPVLSEKADLDELSIPILTEIVDEEELMPVSFPADTLDSSSSAEITPSQTEFLDFPLFELEPIPEPTWSDQALFDADANAVQLQDLHLPASVVLTPPQSISEETAHDADASGADSISVSELDLALDMPELVFPDELTSPADAFASEGTEQWLPHDVVDARSPTEADTSKQIPPPPAHVDLPASSLRLSEDAIDELTATVGAQIAVDISTEVAQLARQHFSAMMNTFYADALRRLTDEVSRDMEMCLAPRIRELVREELRRQGFGET